MRKDIFILNLCEDIPEEMREYLEHRDIRVIDPKNDETPYQWTHILTEHMQDFSFLRDMYKTIENNIQIISLTPVPNKQNFIWANGKIVLNNFWIKSKINNFIFDKIFQEYLSEDIELNEVTFTAQGRFNLHQFHILGDHFDQLVATSSDESVSGVSVRSFLDHTLMYLAGLRNRNKMEFPLEVVYGSSEDAFGLQLYFPSQNLMIEDVSSCLGMEGSRLSEEALLTTALNCCDFLDFSLVSSAKKMVITAAWVKGRAVSDASLLLTTLPHKARLVGYIQEGMVESVPANSEDFLSRIHLPEIRDEEIRRVSGETFSEIIATRISDVLELERIQRIAGTKESEEELVQILKESTQEENEKLVFGSQNEFDDVRQVISSSLDLENEEFVKKDFIKADEIEKIIIKSIQEKKPEALRVKSFETKIAQELQRCLSSFCEIKKMSSGDFTREHIKEFQTYFLNKGLKDNSIILNPLTRQLVKNLRQHLNSSLINEFQESSLENVFEKASAHDFDQARVRSVFKNNLKDALETTFAFEEKGLIKKEEEDVIAEALGSTPVEREVIKDLVQDDTGILPHEPLFSNQASSKEKALMVQIEAIKQDNQSLQEKLQATLLEVRILKESKSTVAGIIAEASSLEQGKGDWEESVALKNEIKNLLTEGNLTDGDKEKVVALLEREVLLMTSYNEEMTKNKRQQIEAVQKERLLVSEIEKLNRQVKTRELMLNKSKESVQKLFQKKDAEVENLKSKLNISNTLLSQEGKSLSNIENKHLKMQNFNLAKQLEVYKVKLSSLSENLNKNREKPDLSRDELRKVKIEKNQIHSMLNQAKKELSRLEIRTKTEVERSQKLQIEVKRLQEELKNKPVEVFVERENSSAMIQEKGEPTPMSESNEAQVKEMENKIIQLESRLAEALRAQKASSLDEKKIVHLETSVKKLTQDINDARHINNELKKESNKLRQEKTALQNQIERMKKEAQKNKKIA